MTRNLIFAFPGAAFFASFAKGADVIPNPVASCSRTTVRNLLFADGGQR